MLSNKLLWTIILLILLLVGAWFIMEGDISPPNISLEKEIVFVGQNRTLEFSVEDGKSGVKSVRVFVKQGDTEKDISSFHFAEKGILTKDLKIDIQPKTLGLKDGKATIRITAVDHSPFKKEMALEKEITIDTHPPRIEMRSLSHYVHIGGSCLVVYDVSKDALKSGVLVNDIFFRGYPLGSEKTHAAYFALPWNASNSTPITLTAYDRADNTATVSFPYKILKKKFRKARMNISDNFLNMKIPEFRSEHGVPGESNLEIYLKVNRRLRAENNNAIRVACEKPRSERLWKGAFLRMKGSPKAQFADRRTYYYNGKAIDKQVHLGVDIAALQRFSVKAANNGFVVLADYVGIYGNTIIIDHGQGLFSMYSHLSSFQVKAGAEVKKGEIIGRTGTTGLAGGDHLHFSIIVHGVYVNPKEWWDSHWIKDNITNKLSLIQSGSTP